MDSSRRRKRQEQRLRDIARSAARLQDVSPAETLDMGVDLIESARSLKVAGEAALVRRRGKGR